MAAADLPNRAQLTSGTSLRLTYAETKRTIDRLAGGLLAAGIRQDDIVMVQLGNTVELVIILSSAPVHNKGS